jgi:hypothetical protein
VIRRIDGGIEGFEPIERAVALHHHALLAENRNDATRVRCALQVGFAPLTAARQVDDTPGTVAATRRIPT